MGGSEPQTTTQTTNAAPWSAAQPALQLGLADAQNLYSSGVGSQPYTGSTVIPFAQQTSQGMSAIQGNAQSNMGGQGVSGQYQDVINSGGFNAPQQSAMGGLGNFAGGAGNVSTGRFNQLGQQASGPSYSEQNLSGIAQGDMLNRSDPNFERALSAASNEVGNQIGMGASAAGRYGSGMHQGNVAREVGNLQATARVGQYNQERANQMNANQMLDSQRMAGLGMGLNAAGQSAGVEAGNYGRQMGALSQQFNAGQQGLGNLGMAYSGMMDPSRDLMGVGSMYEDLAGRLRNDELRIFQEQQNAPWNQLGRLNAVASGAGSMGGTSTGTAQTPGQNPFATGLGYASTGIGLLGGAQDLGWF